MASDSRLNEVFDSVADGDPVDWTDVDSHQTDDDTRGLLKELRIVAAVAGFHRSPEDSSDRTHTAEIPAPPEQPGARRWGRYDLVEKLGRGTYGTVYRAWDADLERFIAVKLLHSLEGMTPILKARMLQEGRAIARVSHKNVVSVLGVEVHEGQAGLCMELVKGRTLDEIVKTQGTLGAHEAITVGQAVCRALAAVHGSSLVHRDVKARNVVREDGGRIVLMDFGAGQVLSDRPGDRRGAAGTPIYMAPEVLGGGTGTIAADIYSTGVLLFFLVTGRYPYEGATIEEVGRAHAKGARRYVTEHRPDLPVSFVRAVEKALDSNPERRQPTAAALLFDLLNTADDDHVGPEPGPTVWQHLSSLLPRNATRALSGIGIVMLLAVALGFFDSWAYGYSLSLDSTFAREGPLTWLRWGLKSMVGPVVLMTAVSLLVLIAVEVVKLVRRVSPVADNAFRRAGKALVSAIEDAGFTPSAALATSLIVVALAFGLWVIFGRFGNLLAAMETPIDRAADATLFRLSPANLREQALYRWILSVGVLALLFGWTVVRRVARRRGERLRPALAAAGVGSVLIIVGLFDFSYRLVWQNDAERALFKGQACYVLGTRDGDVRLFCPKASPRSVVTRETDITRTGIIENIFTAFSQASH